MSLKFTKELKTLLLVEIFPAKSLKNVEQTFFKTFYFKQTIFSKKSQHPPQPDIKCSIPDDDLISYTNSIII